MAIVVYDGDEKLCTCNRWAGSRKYENKVRRGVCPGLHLVKPECVGRASNKYPGMTTHKIIEIVISTIQTKPSPS